MIKWLLLRNDHIQFLNKINEMGEKLRVKLKVDGVTPPATYYKWGCFAQIGIIVFCMFLIANDIFKELHFERFTWLNCIQSILFGSAITVQILIIFYIGFLAAALGQYFDVVLNRLSHVRDIQFTLQKRVLNRVLLLGINLFDELLCLKEDFKKLFDHLLLLMFSFAFVNLTISVYFVLSYSGNNIFSIASAYLFSVFILPHALLFVFLIHFIHKLGDVVTRMSATVNELCDFTTIEIKPFLNSYLLNINYMEQTKYITVADIFTIDYSLLYKMFAAIVTYMVLLLQFRQLEQINDVKDTTNVRATWIK
ncbi:gustatory and pheromone receptor 39a-like [Bradysia coprophila]|uniref:gustatory and pheromone receptor 39a-like n=1 Tax=Bradysia coprophila TaxID=38358 RepID=UPI00187D98A4|nr:gustatory and pheromone receptor 39a-like [Bradysia coprophila]